MGDQERSGNDNVVDVKEINRGALVISLRFLCVVLDAALGLVKQCLAALGEKP